LPHIIFEKNKTISYPVKIKDIEYSFYAKGKNEDKIAIDYKNKQFLLTLKPYKKDLFILKADKATRITPSDYIKQVQNSYIDLTNNKVVSSNTTINTNKVKPLQEYLKGIEYFINDFKTNKDIWIDIGFGSARHLLFLAKKYPNVILEFKTKSNNIKYLLENDVPKNIICTWSLNTQTIIDNEEHLTASLNERINSARALANKGVLVGFHFHPIVVYKNYLSEYKKIYNRLLKEFKSDEVVLISMGTLTFIKPVIKKLRERELKTKILQMPFETINGKKSYSLDIKKEMFKHCYNSFKPWHNKVYFYMCMEEHSLWKDVFGYEYCSNNQFEDFMLRNYMDKISKEKFIYKK
jgi:DNA repair photolyase